MNEFVFLIFLILFLVALVLGPLLGITYLCRPDFFKKHVFPSSRPRDIFFSKEKGDADRLVFYYGARLFLACLAAMGVILMLLSFSRN